jgi:TonB family protein
MRILTCGLILLSFAFSATAIPQQPSDRDQGIALFKQKDALGAIKLLKAAVKRNPEDGEAWYFLGLALNLRDDLKAARKAFENATKNLPAFAPGHSAYAYTLLATNRTSDAADEARRALELDSDNADAHYVLGAAYLRGGNAAIAKREADLAVKLKPVFPFAYLLQYQAVLVGYAQRAASWRSNSGAPPKPGETNNPTASNPKRAEVFENAANALATYLKQRPEDDTPMWHEQLDTLRVFAGASSDPTVSSRDVEVRARVLSKPEPQYTEAARNADISGTVILQAIFTSRGTVEHILVLSYLPYGLTEAAIAVAKKIKFVPAMKEGRPVSMFMQLEYNFNLY